MSSTKGDALLSTPRIGRPPGTNSDATRLRIVRAASECFGAKGYESTTNRDIGERAGVTGAAIYQYFDSKHELFLECYGAALRDVVPYLRAAVAGAANSREAFKLLTVAYAETWRVFPVSSAFLSCIPGEILRHLELGPVLSSEQNTVATIVAEITERGIQSGEIDSAISTSVASMFFSIILGLGIHAALLGAQEVREAAEGYAHLLDGRVFR